MQYVFLICLMVAGALALPAVIPVLERTESRDDHGQFALRYISGDGTTVVESGELRLNPDGKDYSLHKKGEYSFSAPNGQVFRTKYVADDQGFHVEGDHLPKSVVA